MSIQTAIENAQQKVANAYTAVDNKGGTLPATQDLANLPNAISTISTGGTIDSLNVTPSTSAQTITASGGVDGYSPVNVSAVDASIDSNIQPNNILDGVTILSVTGNVVELNATTASVTPTTSAQTITPTSPYNAFDEISVSAVTSAIDSSIQPENIKKDVVILGTTGTYEGSGGIGITREVSATGVYQIPTSSFTFALPSNATDVGTYAMHYAFRDCTGLTSVDLSSLTTVSGNYAMDYAFYGCTGLTSVDLSSLTTVSGSNSMLNAFRGTGLTSVVLSSLTTVSGSNTMASSFQNCTGLISADLSSLTTVSNTSAMSATFYGCTGLISADLSSLTTVSGSYAMSSTFYGCTGLTNVDLSNLQTIGLNTSTGDNSQFPQCFADCTSLTSLTFPNLEKIYCTGTATSNGTFANNNKVQKMYFPKLDTITKGTGASTTTACKNIFYGCSSLTELHFGAANQSAIEASPGYSTAWGRGAGNVTIYFDL